MQELTPRQRQILKMVVALFIESAEAVSSRTLARRFRLPYSPATIRNEMADLEELGFLEQPHTSAGRIPTEKGYQTYVAGLESIECEGPERVRLETLELEALDSCKEAEELLRDAISILAMVTRLVGVAAFPSLRQATFTKLQLTSIDSRQILVALVTDSSHAEAHLLQVERPVPQDRLEVFTRIINEQFTGRPISEFVAGSARVIRTLESSYREQLEKVLQLLMTKIGKPLESEVLIWGAASVLDQPEFQDVQRARAILDALEKREFIGRMLASIASSGSQITFVGVDGNPEMMPLKDFSLVSSVYRVRGTIKGAIGILGPRRMDYPRVIGYVNHISDSLTRVLSDK
ncbi:MAG: heat-inducible transcription repressor HrcA [Candidatus Wallbacteria bacterium]|nr:heat-inducible transcription repressor HrcA [Candidatus Wallbacteria bacterium]